jgi:hypothetical protein
MSITVLTSTESGADSLIDINANFADLDTTKADGAASSTDNAIARFDGITGKLLQNSGVIVNDYDVASTSYVIKVADQVGTKGDTLKIRGGHAGADSAGGPGYFFGGDGNGTGAGGESRLQAGPGGATGAGGSAIVQGGAGGATSGNGGNTNLYGGNATNGNSDGGGVYIIPGAKQGSGAHGQIALYQYRGASYQAALDLSLIASSNKTFTFPNETGTFALRGANTFTGAQQFDVNSDSGAGDGNFHIDADTGGICRLQVYTPGTYAQHPLHLQALRILLRSTAGLITANGAINYAADAGSSDTYAITLDPAPSDYYTGMQVIFKANTANTGAASLNVNALGAKTIVKAVSTALSNNDILASMFCLCVYDGTNFVLMNPRAL